MIRVQLSCGDFAFLSDQIAVRYPKGSTIPCSRCGERTGMAPLVAVVDTPVGDNVRVLPEPDLTPETELEQQLCAMVDEVFGDEELPEQGRYRPEEPE